MARRVVPTALHNTRVLYRSTQNNALWSSDYIDDHNMFVGRVSQQFCVIYVDDNDDNI